VSQGHIKTFGRTVHTLRSEHKMTQEQLAELTDLDVSFISGIENGRHEACLGTIIKLAGAFNVDIERLFAGIKIRHTQK
jgi:putative transcriptional regulator